MRVCRISREECFKWGRRDIWKRTEVFIFSGDQCTGERRAQGIGSDNGT